MPDKVEATRSCMRSSGHQPWSWRRLLVFSAVTVLIVAMFAELYFVFFGSNVHEIIPGRVFRCAQLSAPELEKLVAKHGIRTIINLRGCCAPQDWYLEECRAAQRLNVSLEDICMSAGRFPSVPELRELVRILDHAECPLLIHCKQGADRTGLVATFVQLLQTDSSLQQARWQLSPLYGHIPLGRPSNLGRFLDLYSDWLNAQGQEHCSTSLRRWLEHESCPGMYRCRFEPIGFPRRLKANAATALVVRVHNTSSKSWRFQPENHAGIHGCFALFESSGKFLHVGRAGLFDAIIEPSGSIDLQLPLPGLAAGTYRLFVDMVDEPHCPFHQTGSEPLEMDLVVE